VIVMLLSIAANLSAGRLVILKKAAGRQTWYRRMMTGELFCITA